MHQLAQKLKTGILNIVEVPCPQIKAKSVLVRNHFSLISAGTESSTVKTARKGYLGKAKERPQQAKQVVDMLKQQGPVKTYRAVMKKLDAYSPLGYSCAGEVIAVGEGVADFKIGDKVACGGISASHADIVCVPVQLCAKLDSGTDLSQAAYNTLGAIAMQGVRQADLRLGETCTVIGLGLLGQLTCLLLKASGVRTIGVDIDSGMVNLAAEHCADLALMRNSTGINEKIFTFTEGIGSDAVIITAATNSMDPINFAGAISRKNGTVVVVGAVPTGFDREPHYYKKELQIRMSCSYGPGRYDPIYEEHGVDYPVSHVRWTEQRNMASFQKLIANGHIDIKYLTTHIFDLEEAPKAYEMIMERSEVFAGLLIRYNHSRKIGNDHPIHLIAEDILPGNDEVSIGFIGAGSYAQSNLLPYVKGMRDVSLKGILTSSGTSARSVAERFGFESCAQNISDIIENNRINTVFIATRHDSHADYVINSLKAGKNVFVEKPLCLNKEELIQIFKIYNNDSKKKRPLLMVGYNRRFSPMVQRVKDAFGDGPMAMNYRVNAGSIPAESWIQDPAIGGGRIIGEVGHFVDLMTFINGSLPVSVYAKNMSSPCDLQDTVTISLSYANGSIGTISYFANGDKKLPKEHFEVFTNGCSAVIHDFRRLDIYEKGKLAKVKKVDQDKGQKSEVAAFINRIIEGGPAPIELDALFNTSLVTFKALESIACGQAIRI